MFSGVANAVVTDADLDAPVSYEGLAAVGSGMGSAGFIVYDDTACMVDAAYRFSRFLSIESCGQCSPCKLGSAEITQCLQRIETGAGTDDDLEIMGGWLPRVTDASRCYLASEERIVVCSILRAFPEEFADHIEHQRCPSPRQDPMPKLVDLRDGQRHLRRDLLAQAPGLDLRARVGAVPRGAYLHGVQHTQGAAKCTQ